MTRYPRIVLIAAITAVFGLAVGWVFMPPTWKRRARMLPEVWGFVRPATHTFHVSGNVVDHDGNQVPGVLMIISEYTPSIDGQGDRERNTRDRIDGVFSVHSQGFKILRLEFHKEGYKSEVLSFKSEGTFENCDVFLKKDDEP